MIAFLIQKNTTTKPLNQNKMKSKQERREEMNGIGAMIIIFVITICIIAFTLQTIFNII